MKCKDCRLRQYHNTGMVHTCTIADPDIEGDILGDIHADCWLNGRRVAALKAQLEGYVVVSRAHFEWMRRGCAMHLNDGCLRASITNSPCPHYDECQRLMAGDEGK